MTGYSPSPLSSVDRELDLGFDSISSGWYSGNCFCPLGLIDMFNKP